MKAGLKMGARMLGYYLTLALLSMLFLAMLGESAYWLQIILNVVLLGGFAILLLNDGGYTGEKACTLKVTLDKRREDGLFVDPVSEKDVWNRKVALIGFIFVAAPLLLISLANFAYDPVYEGRLSAYVEQYGPIEEEDAAAGPFGNLENPNHAVIFDDDEVAKPTPPLNWIRAVARFVYMPFVSLYALLTDRQLSAIFLALPLLIPLPGTIGYLMGPRLRQKKLDDIAKGVKKKRRNLKVNQKRRTPRGPKHEV